MCAEDDDNRDKTFKMPVDIWLEMSRGQWICIYEAQEDDEGW